MAETLETERSATIESMLGTRSMNNEMRMVEQQLNRLLAHTNESVLNMDSVSK
jgi:hypothetical protein